MIKKQDSKRKRCRRFFRKLRIPFSRALIHSSRRGVHEVRLTLLESRLSAHDLRRPHAHIVIAHLLGYRIRVQRLPEKRTDGCIAYLSYFHEGRLKYREELMRESEDTVDKQIFFPPIVWNFRGGLLWLPIGFDS
ncbi:hypothetical protein EZS27_010033 [termite gut metagenome]|uniref:Uncharacterized protein n=1 Tax=termite gut metagenome TaxID=433724 RepID=A0A5J4S7S1_9ZZZZ